MILLTGERPGRLATIASHGYPEHGVGSEVGFGEGIIGMAAEARKPIRISGLLSDMLYAHAVATRAREQGIATGELCIPLPGLERPESQLGIPLLAHGEPLGVLCVESARPHRFHEQDKAYLELLGSWIALAIQNALLRERERSGRVKFTNRELRLDKTLSLPELKDNLESRLILLRKRLADRCPELEIVPSGRGRFRFEAARRLVLSSR